MKSQTLIPELMIDQKSGEAYYDCPGFMDTRSTQHDLTIAYFLNKLLTYADSFKLVFVVTYSSVMECEQRTDFVTLVKNAVKLVKNIEKYSDGIALIVTKVKDPDANDEIIVDRVAHFLNEVNEHLSEEAPDFILRSTRILLGAPDFFINSNGNSYSRIGILRRARIPGHLNEKMKVLQTERNQLRMMINQHIKCVRKESDDFGFIISPESKNHVVELTDKIAKEEFASDAANVSREIEEFYREKEDRISDVSDLYDVTKLGADLFSAIRTEDPRLFLKEIVNTTYLIQKHILC